MAQTFGWGRSILSTYPGARCQVPMNNGTDRVCRPEEPAMRAIIRRLSDRLSSRELAKGYVSVR